MKKYKQHMQIISEMQIAESHGVSEILCTTVDGNGDSYWHEVHTTLPKITSETRISQGPLGKYDGPR